MNETALVNLIKNYLLIKGHYVWRNNTGAMKLQSINKRGIKSDRFFRAGMTGSSDIIGIAKDGKFIAVECKIKPNKPTLLQNEFLQNIKDRGGYAIVAYDLCDVEVLL